MNKNRMSSNELDLIDFIFINELARFMNGRSDNFTRVFL